MRVKMCADRSVREHERIYLRSVAVPLDVRYLRTSLRIAEHSGSRYLRMSGRVPATLFGRGVLVGGEVSICTLARRDDCDATPAADAEQVLIARHDQRRPRRERAREEFVVIRIGRHLLREGGRIDDRRRMHEQRQDRVQWGRERRVARREDGAPSRYSARMAGETSASRSSCHAVSRRTGTPPKKIPERSTLVSRIMRTGVERDTGAIIRADSELLGPARAMAGRGDRLRHVTASHSALLRGFPSLPDERGEVTRRRRLQDFEDHDVLVAEHDELRAGFEPEAHPDLFGDDDLALGRQSGGGGFTHDGSSENLTGKIMPDAARRKLTCHTLVGAVPVVITAMSLFSRSAAS